MYFLKNTYISIYFAFSREFLFLRSIERLVSFLITVLSIDYILWLANAFIFNAQWIIEQMRFLISSVYWFFFLLLNNCYEKFYSHSFYSHSLRKPLCTLFCTVFLFLTHCDVLIHTKCIISDDKIAIITVFFCMYILTTLRVS